MIPSAAAQHRSKHFDQLLERELAYIERGHEQNLITYDKLERSIEHDRSRTLNIKRKRFSFPPINQHSSRQSDVSHSSVVSSALLNHQSVISEISETSIPRFHRHCYKPHRLPPIIKQNRTKATKAELHLIAINAVQATADSENETIPLIKEERLKKTSPILKPIDKQIHSFMESLPTYKGAHKGFDNFAPAALYSHRTTIAMR